MLKSLVPFYHFIFILFIIIILLLYEKRHSYYYKCSVKNNFKSNSYFFPLCTYDIKYRNIIIYGYTKNTNQSRYLYSQISMNNLADIKSLNISFKKVIVNKKQLSLCIVSIDRFINIINLVRNCMLYRILGVDHITLYISYINSTYTRYYKWLRKAKWIDFISISYPNIDIFYNAQDSKLNHCINHYRYISEYVIVTDIDEIIVPQKDEKLKDIIYKYDKDNYVFSFKSVLFYIKSNFESIFDSKKLGCLVKNGYEKMILRPEKVICIGAHFPKIWQQQKKIVYINVNDAYVRHSRNMKLNIMCNIHDSKVLIKNKKEIEKYIESIS